MAGLQGYDCEGILTINSWSFSNAAWMVYSDEQGAGGLLQLLGSGASRIGEDLVVPGLLGVVANPRRRTAQRYDLNMMICGDIDGVTGLPTSNAFDGIVANVKALTDSIVELSSVGPQGLQPATWDTGAVTYAADIHVLGIQISAVFQDKATDQALALGTLQISIPDGRFA